MKRVRLFLQVLVCFGGLSLVSLTACSRLLGPSADVPEYQPPSETEKQQMMERMMGKAPAQEARVSTDGVQVVFQKGHTAVITAVTMSPNGRYIATGSMDETVKVWDVASGQQIQEFTSTMMAGWTGLAFGPDSKTLVIGDMQGGKVYDVDSGRELRSFTLLSAHMAVSGDGRLLAASGSGRAMTVWDLTTGKTLPALSHAEDLVPLAFTPDGRLLATQEQEGREGGPIALWDLATGKATRKLRSTENVFRAALSRDGRLLATQTLEGGLTLHDVHDGQVLHVLKSGGVESMYGSVGSFVFSPDSRLLAAGDYASKLRKGQVRFLDVRTGREVRQLNGIAVAFSADGQTVVLGEIEGGAPILVELASGKETRLSGGATGVTDLALNADGRMVVASMEDRTAKLWDLATGQIMRVFAGPAETSVALSPDGRLVATGGRDGVAALYDVGTGRQLRVFGTPKPLTAETMEAVHVRFSPDGRALTIAQKDQVLLWDVGRGAEARKLTVPIQRSPMMAAAGERPQVALGISAVSFSPDGRLLAVGSQGSIGLWDLAGGRLVRTLGAASGGMMAPLGMPRMGEEGGLAGLFGLGGGTQPAMPLPGQPEGMPITDPAALIESMVGIGNTKSLAFSPDGRLLLAVSSMGKSVWEVATGKKLRVGEPRVTNPMDMSRMMEVNMGGGAAFSPDGRIAARGHGSLVKLWDVATGQDRLTLGGHTSNVEAVAFTPDGRSLVTGAKDGSIRLWNVQTGKEVVALIGMGQEDYVAVTPDQYYRASKTRIKGVAFRVKEQLYPFEQFDLRFNRPDVVLHRLGRASPDLIQSYRFAYERRLKKMGLTEQMLGRDFHLPEVELLTTDVPVSVNAAVLTLRVKASDSKYQLDRVNVFVNDVPLYGTAGLPVPNRQVQTHEQEIQVPLVPGRNKVQVSVLNQQGVESLKQTVYTTSTVQAPPPQVYVVGIGVSEYKDKAYNLRYAAKDATDLLNTYKAIEQRQGNQSHVHTLSLTDRKATRPEILKAKAWLKQSKITDLVVVFAAGHGMTDEQSNYYFGTHDIDPHHPATNGLPYEEFENLLDGIPALQKLLLLDTCFSGEIEKDQAVVVAQAQTGGSGTVKMRAFKAARGVTVTAESSGEGGSATAPGGPRLSAGMLKFQQDWFADLRRGTGAAVISSSSGNEYSLEGEQWKNGVFTYALLNGLKNHGADANHDQTITVSELQAYVIEQVRKLTQGGQNPTVRRENLEYDFMVY